MRLFISYLFLIIALPGTAQQIPAENVHLHTDKSLYMPGEVLWFKPYVVNASTRIYAPESAIIYVELIDKEAVSVLHAKIENTPEAHGSIYIPQGISSGTYSLKAYTLQMKKQGLFFSKQIRIINPYLTSPVTITAENFDFQLFPEGGTLLHGIPCKIGHKLTDSRAKGQLHHLTLSENGQPVVRLSVSDALGMGSFIFTPDAGAVYTVHAEVQGRIVASVPFPRIERKGVLMNAIPEKDRYNLRIYSTEKTPLTLSYMSAEGSLKYKELNFSADGNAETAILKNELTEGTSCLTLYNSARQPVIERVVFRRFGDTLTLETLVSNKNLKKRTETTLSVKNTAGASSKLSVAIRRIDQLNGGVAEDIFTTLFLRKNILGRIEQPDYYLSGNSSEKELDDLLITQGWRKITQSIPENRYHQIRIKFTDKETNQPLSGQNALLSIPGANVQVFPAETDADGIATFFVKNIYGPSQLAIKLVSNKPSHVEIIPPFPQHEKPGKAGLPEIDPKELSFQAINTQAENSYFAKERAVFNPSLLADSIPFYGEPDARYFLDDYTRFVLMEEVLREYVKEVRVRKSRDNYEIRIFDYANNILFKESPLILLDGIPLNDANEVIRYDPLKMKKIEVLYEAFMYGGVTYDGVVSFNTYKSVLEDFKLDAATTLLNYDGVQYQRVFYTPKYPAEEARKPDTRTLLYWNPNASLNEILKFSTSDIAGKYLIDIQGIDGNGRPGRARAYLTVD